jgi:hypothetical protein
MKCDCDCHSGTPSDPDPCLACASSHGIDLNLTGVRKR